MFAQEGLPVAASFFFCIEPYISHFLAKPCPQPACEVPNVNCTRVCECTPGRTEAPQHDAAIKAYAPGDTASSVHYSAAVVNNRTPDMAYFKLLVVACVLAAVVSAEPDGLGKPGVLHDPMRPAISTMFCARVGLQLACSWSMRGSWALAALRSCADKAPWKVSRLLVDRSADAKVPVTREAPIAAQVPGGAPALWLFLDCSSAY